MNLNQGSVTTEIRRRLLIVLGPCLLLSSIAGLIVVATSPGEASTSGQASWPLAIQTAVLAATGWLVGIYAWWTKDLVAGNQELLEVLRRQYEALTRPMLTFQLIAWQPMLVKLRIENTGAAPAFDISGSIESVVDGGSVTRPWSYRQLGSQRYEEFRIPLPDGSSHQDELRVDVLKPRVTSVTAKLSYSSASGEKYELDESIHISAVLEDMLKSGMLATPDHPERIPPRVAKALEDIAERLRNRQ